MSKRIELQSILENLLDSTNVYFQPPSNFQLKYPCIVYKRSRRDTKFADNKPYTHKQAYTVTVIDKNPDSLIPDKIANLQLCSFNTHYTKDNLNHDVFTLYY